MKNINIDEIITVENLKSFLSKLGFEWNGAYYHPYMEDNGMEDKPKKAEKISELLNDDFTFFVELFTSIEKDGQRGGQNLYVKIGVDYFLLSILEDRTDLKFPLSTPKDYTKEWIMHLIEECDKKYVRVLTYNIDKQIKSVIRENKVNNKELKEKIKQNDKELTSKLRYYGNLSKDIFDAVYNKENETSSKENKDNLTK